MSQGTNGQSDGFDGEAQTPAFSTEQIKSVANRMRRMHYRRHRRRAVKSGLTVVLSLVNLAGVLLFPEVVYTAVETVPVPLPFSPTQFYWLTVATLALTIPLTGRETLKAWRNRIPEEGRYVKPALEVLTEYVR